MKGNIDRNSIFVIMESNLITPLLHCYIQDLLVIFFPNDCVKQEIQEESKIKTNNLSEGNNLKFAAEILKKTFLQTGQKASVCGIAKEKLYHYH